MLEVTSKDNGIVNFDHILQILLVFNFRIQSEYRKMRTKKDSVFGHLLRSVFIRFIIYLFTLYLTIDSFQKLMT